MEKNVISIELLIQLLLKEQQGGGTTIEYNGTLLCVDNGNSIILSDEKQM